MDSRTRPGEPPDRRQFIEAALGAACAPLARRRNRPADGPQDLLGRVRATAGRFDPRTPPPVCDIPDVLATCGCDRGDRDHVGKAAFGNAGQFDAGSVRFGRTLAALGEGLGLPDGIAPDVGVVGRIVAPFLGQSDVKAWPVLAVATPVNVATAPGRSGHQLRRVYESPRHAPYGSGRLRPVLEFGFENHPLGFRLPPVSELKLMRPPAADGGSVVHRLSYRAETWAGGVKLSEDFYDHLVFPLEPTARGVRAFMPYTPPEVLAGCRPVTRGGGPVGTAHPSLDVWLVDPAGRPGGGVTGYLLKFCFHPDGRMYRLAASRRRMGHILAEGPLTRAALARFLPS